MWLLPNTFNVFRKVHAIKGDELNIETLGCQLHTKVIYNQKINKLISIIDLKKNPDGEGTRGITVKAQTSGTNKFIVTLIIDLNLPIWSIFNNF